MELDEEELYDMPTEEELLAALKTVALPYIRGHGGNMQICEITPDGTIVVEMSGTCSDCSAQEITLKVNIERTLRRIFPAVKKVLLKTDTF